MSPTTAPQSPESPAGNPEVQAGHWNDQFLIQSGEPAAFKEGVNADALRDGAEPPETNQEAAERHMVDVWQQEQVLLDMAVAKIEGRESTTSPEDLRSLGITEKCANKSFSLVNEFYLRMGAVNEMGRSDVLLTGLAGLVAQEVATETVPGFGAKYESHSDPIERSFAIINDVAGRLREQPELVEGREGAMLLVAELLSEALRSPNSVRNKLGVVAGIDAEDLNTDFYEQSIIQICDAVISQVKPKIEPSAEGLSGKQLKKQEGRLFSLQAAVVTKYDTLFDTLEAGSLPATDGKARQILDAFIAEASPIIDQREALFSQNALGFAYELFAPLMFRYVSLENGVVDQARVWHSPTRSDLPSDRLGAKPSLAEGPEHVAQHIKKQSSDIQVGTVTQIPDSTDRQFGVVIEQLQLKARADAEEIYKGYDERFVGLHSEDMVSLLTYLDERLQKVDPVYTALPDGFDHKNPAGGKENFRTGAAEQVVRGLIQELTRRVSSPNAEPNHEFVVRGASTEIHVDLPRIFDDIVLPVYQRLVQDTTGQKIESDKHVAALVQ